MAGAGYKLFNTGDVLTAAQVNTYLMEQTVMVFADAAARTTALTGVVSEGMISYLKDTNAVEVYNGSAWVASDDPNAIQNTIVDAKGDLITATAADTPARIAVGNDGETLVADSSTSTGLRWQGDYASGKNKVINGDFGIWQRGTTFNSASSNTYFADRFTCYVGGGTHNITRQTFTPGTAPVAGYEGQYFLRWTAATAGSVSLTHRIENVQTFAGQTITFSFWAKADSAINISTAVYQVFGSGGSGTVSNFSGNQALTTSWARYSFTFNVASIASKTIGTSSYFQLDINLPSSTFVFDTWGWQVEAGSVATDFQTATGTLAGELAACQRYYFRRSASVNAVAVFYDCFAYSTTAALATINFPQAMRAQPNEYTFGNLAVQDIGTAANTAFTASNVNQSNTTSAQILFTGMTGLTQYRPYGLVANNNTAAYFALSAEL